MKSSIYIWKILLGIYLSSLFLISCRPNYGQRPIFKSLDVNYIPQYQSFWCWAACSQMVMEYLDPNGINAQTYLQCEQAAMSMPEFCCNQPIINNCCPINGTWTPGNSIDPACNHTHWPMFEKCHFSCKDTDTDNNYLSWKKMLQQIDSSNPLCLTYNFIGGGAHMVVMDGYKIDNGELYDEILDPNLGFVDPTFMYTCNFILHSDVRHGIDHTLGRCYYNIKKLTN